MKTRLFTERLLAGLMFRAWGLCVLAGLSMISAHAGVLLSIEHDGTPERENHPFKTRVLSKDASWRYATDGDRKIMTATDNATEGDQRLILVEADGITQFAEGGGPAGKGWVFEIELQIPQGRSDNAGRGFAHFGVRSENQGGKSVWIGLSEQGGREGSGRIGFNAPDGTFIGTPVSFDVDGLIGDGKYHNVKIYKSDDDGATVVDVIMDGRLVLSTPYALLDDDADAADIQGFVSSTPTPLSEVKIDFIKFTLYDNLADSAPTGFTGTRPKCVEKTLAEVAVPAQRPTSAPKYSDVCFRYGWIRECLPEMFKKDTARGVEFPKITDAKKAIQDFHATRIDWFYPGYHTANPGVEHVAEMAKEFIDWCHARGMKVIGAMNTNTSTKEIGFKRAHFGRYVGDVNNPKYVETAVAWGKEQVDAGVDGLLCDDFFKYSAIQKQQFSDKVIAAIKAYKPGFEIAGNNGGWIGTEYVQRYAFDYHYSDSGFVPRPGTLWKVSKEHRALNSAFLMHPNKNMSKATRRQQIGLCYASGAHLIAPWDEYIHGKLSSGSAVPRLFADPSGYADLYGFARALGQMGYLDGYEDAAVAGYDLKEDRYGGHQPMALSPATAKVSVFARAMPGKADAPVVIHLIHMGTPEAFQLKLRKKNFFGDRHAKYQLLSGVSYSKEAHEKASQSGDYGNLVKTVDLEATKEEDFITLDVPAIHPWGVVVVSPVKEYSGNPIFRNAFTADASPIVGQDGRLWVCTSGDVPVENAKDYRHMDHYRCYSTDNMVDWKYHGVILSSSDLSWKHPKGGFMFAPDIACKDGKYYLYFPHNIGREVEGIAHGWRIGVAISDKPEGPFVDSGQPIKGPEDNPTGMRAFDPCCFIDDDGAAYLYWGYGLANTPYCYVARLKDNMTELAEAPRQVNVGARNFFEAAFVYKRNGKYYLAYNARSGSRGAHYGMGDSPYGPFVHKGQIAGSGRGAQAHPGIVDYKDKSYYFYQRGDFTVDGVKGSRFRRVVCVDELHYNPDGTIQRVKLTNQGVKRVD